MLRYNQSVNRRRAPVISVLPVRPEASEAFESTGVVGLRRLVKAFGDSELAQLLGVDQAQVSGWINGRDAMSFEMRCRVIDLAYVIDRALQLMAPEIVNDWLFGSEPLLGGARPIDALLLKGLAPLIRALDGIYAGAFA